MMTQQGRPNDRHDAAGEAIFWRPSYWQASLIYVQAASGGGSDLHGGGVGVVVSGGGESEQRCSEWRCAAVTALGDAPHGSRPRALDCSLRTAHGSRHLRPHRELRNGRIGHGFG
jgi:hypothetical protein